MKDPIQQPDQLVPKYVSDLADRLRDFKPGDLLLLNRRQGKTWAARIAAAKAPAPLSASPGSPDCPEG